MLWDYKTAQWSAECLVVLPDDDIGLLDIFISETGALASSSDLLFFVSGHLRDNIALVDVVLSSSHGVSLQCTDIGVFIADLLVAYTDFSVPGARLFSEWKHCVEQRPSIGVFERQIELALGWYLLLESVFNSCGIVDVTVSHSRRSGWWTTRSKVVPLLDLWVKRLTVAAEAGVDLPELKDSARKIRSCFSNLERSPDNPAEVVFATASAFSFLCAQYHLSRHNYATSLAMANRAAEYLLLSVACAEKLVNIENTSIKTKAGLDVSVATLVDVLVAHGILVSSGKSVQLLRSINTTRNQLGLTHGLACPTPTDISITLKELKSVLLLLGVDLGWSAVLNSMKPWTARAGRVLHEIFEIDRYVKRFI